MYTYMADTCICVLAQVHTFRVTYIHTSYMYPSTHGHMYLSTRNQSLHFFSGYVCMYSPMIYVYVCFMYVCMYIYIHDL